MTAKELIKAYEGLTKEAKEEVNAYWARQSSAKPGRREVPSEKKLEAAAKAHPSAS